MLKITPVDMVCADDGYHGVQPRARADTVFADASGPYLCAQQPSTQASLVPSSFRSSMTALQLTPSGLDSSSSLPSGDLLAAGTTGNADQASRSRPSHANPNNQPPMHSLPEKSYLQTSDPSPTIITDGCQYLELSPRSLLTPRSTCVADVSAALPGCGATQPSGGGVGHDSERLSPAAMAARGRRQRTLCSGMHALVQPGNTASARHVRRLAGSPSDDDCSPDGGRNALRTPAYLPAMLQCVSPSEPTSSCGMSGTSSAGRLVCNLIERFNNTQLYDGINDSP
jgi:hypothetical protein